MLAPICDWPYGLVAFVGVMVGMAYAAVPLYSLFCQVTGLWRHHKGSNCGPATTLTREMTVRFDANISAASAGVSGPRPSR